MNPSIFDNSPWLVSEDRFCQVYDSRLIDSLLHEAKESYSFLTICDMNLNLHFKSVMIRVNRNSLQLDKPIEWDNGSRIRSSGAQGNGQSGNSFAQVPPALPDQVKRTGLDHTSTG